VAYTSRRFSLGIVYVVSVPFFAVCLSFTVLFLIERQIMKGSVDYVCRSLLPSSLLLAICWCGKLIDVPGRHRNIELRGVQ
jgi:hypothetical protein